MQHSPDLVPTLPIACVIVHYGDVVPTLACISSLLAGDAAPYVILVSNTSAEQSADLFAQVAVLFAARADAARKEQEARRDEQSRLRELNGRQPLRDRRATLAPRGQGRAESGSAALSSSAAEYPVTYISMDGNKGFAAACNAGMEAARELSGPRGLSYVWLLNNDTLVAPDAATRLRSYLVQYPQAIVGTSVLQMREDMREPTSEQESLSEQVAPSSPAPERLELALGCLFFPWTTVIKPCYGGALATALPSYLSAPRVDYVYGASMAFDLELLQRIGLMDTQFFLYYEEHDYCLRARAAGYAFHWCREARVWHQGGGSSGGQSSSPGKSQKPSAARQFAHYHETRSTWLFLKKHYPWCLPVALVVRTCAKMVLLPARGKASLLGSYWRGLWDAFTK